MVVKNSRRHAKGEGRASRTHLDDAHPTKKDQLPKIAENEQMKMRIAGYLLRD